MSISRLPMNNYHNDFISENVESIFNSISDGVCITDSSGLIQFINHAFGRIFGVTLRRVKMLPIQNIIKTELVRHAVSRKKSMDGEIILHQKILKLDIKIIEDQFGIQGYHIFIKEVEDSHVKKKKKGQLISPFPKIIGNNHEFVKSLVRAEKAAKKHVTVLLRGESGTGKELLANQIHLKSRRSSGPFVAINCAAIPENLIESELFGHEAGSFTGASGLKKGHFEIADGGTIFLDEIGDLPHHLQVKLLRVLQERVIRRVGGNKEISINVRIITATHQDLEKMVEEKRFREDLFYRLNVIAINLNPLRERSDDLEEIINHFLESMLERHQIKQLTISEEAKHALLSYTWPGNIREVKNVLERAVIMADESEITLEDLPSTVTNRYSYEDDNRQQNPLFNLKGDGTLAKLEEYILEVINYAVDYYGSFHAAGKALGINHKTVASKYRKYMGEEETEQNNSTILKNYQSG